MVLWSNSSSCILYLYHFLMSNNDVLDILFCIFKSSNYDLHYFFSTMIIISKKKIYYKRNCIQYIILQFEIYNLYSNGENFLWFSIFVDQNIENYWIFFIIFSPCWYGHELILRMFILFAYFFKLILFFFIGFYMIIFC